MIINILLFIYRETMGEKVVNVSVTPNGYADAVASRQYVNKNNEIEVKEYFVLPEERQIKMKTFIDILEKRIDYSGVFYLQEQNSNLTRNFGELLSDIDSEVAWAREAFNEAPDAINLWIGDSSAVTSRKSDFNF